MTELNPGERRFAAYLDEHGYSWKHEPDYQVELGLGYSLATKPDFLVEREDQRAVAEVRQFESSVLQNQLSGMGRGGAVAPEKVFGQQRSALWEKAEQLRPLAGVGVPLLIVLANALGKLVPLDDFHVQSAMWGNPGFAFPIDTTTGGPAEGRKPYFRLEDYGVFASPLFDDHKVVGWRNRHPHVTAVVVVHERPTGAKRYLPGTALPTARWMPPSSPPSKPYGRLRRVSSAAKTGGLLPVGERLRGERRGGGAAVP
ncbi:MAG: hypothetical protein ACXVHJ_35780, partial [Solirubrobacteraceae bacterium]